MSESNLGVTEKSNLFALDLVLGQRKDIVLILQKNNTLGTSLSDQSLMFWIVDSSLVRDMRVLEAVETLQELKHMSGSLVNSLLGSLASLNGGKDILGLPPSGRTRHLEI
ncbi:hypothetical protein HG530_004190 [Fusarium avenaceum]|nr:hypothetical protein HG530_004190 [Fusarium avenaceum]